MLFLSNSLIIVNASYLSHLLITFKYIYISNMNLEKEDKVLTKKIKNLAKRYGYSF